MNYLYTEQCVSCQHQGLCFKYLELAGDIPKHGQPIFCRCADVLADPEGMEIELENKIYKWRKQMEDAQGSEK